MTEKRKEILDNSHLNCVKDLARKYFLQSSIDFSCLTMSDFDKLQQFIQLEINKLVADPDYRMITTLKVKPKIKKNHEGVFLRISGSYFSDDREGISFYNHPQKIGFCGEMDGCNQIPFIIGFVKWIDSLTLIKTK